MTHYRAKLLSAESFSEYVKHQTESFYTKLEPKSQLLEIFFQKLSKVLMLKMSQQMKENFRSILSLWKTK